MEKGIGESALGLSQGAWTFWPPPQPTFPTPNPQVSTQFHSGHHHTRSEFGVHDVESGTGQDVAEVTAIHKDRARKFPSRLQVMWS